MNDPQSANEEGTEVPRKVIKLSEMIDGWLQAALEKHSLGEEVVWEGGLMGLPTQVQGQLAPMYVLYVQIPGAVLNTRLMMTSMVEPAALLNEDALDKMIMEMMNGMRGARARQRDEMIKQGVGDNGRRSSGLIFPPGVQPPPDLPDDLAGEAMRAHMQPPTFGDMERGSFGDMEQGMRPDTAP